MTVENFIRKKLKLPLRYKYHAFIKKYCKGRGLEIGGAAHNDYGINALNVDISEHTKDDDAYKIEQLKLANKVKSVDIIASGDNIPVPDNSQDFVFSSHVLEHFYNPLAAIREWQRVCKKNKYIAIVLPSKEVTFDKDRDCTTISEFYERDRLYDRNKIYPDKHWSVWTLETFLDMANEFNLNVVDYVNHPPKLESSFIVIIKNN